MRKYIITYVFAAIVTIVVTSCSSTAFYQFGTISPVNNSMKNTNDELSYSDNNISIKYDFWSEYGKIVCEIENTSNKDITIHFDKSYFIKDTYAYDYYGVSNYTSEKGASNNSTGISSILGKFIPSAGGAQASNGVLATNVVDYVSINIPAKSVKNIGKYNIIFEMYRDCDVYLFETNKNMKTSMDFTKETTPMLFENRFTYTVDGENREYKVNNGFYVSNISNISEEKFKVEVKKEPTICPDEVIVDEKAKSAKPAKPVYKVELPRKANSYYIKYIKESFPKNIKH